MSRPTIITNLDTILVNNIHISLTVGTGQAKETIRTTLMAFDEFIWYLAPVELMEHRPFQVHVENRSLGPLLIIPTYDGSIFQTGKSIDYANLQDVLHVQPRKTWVSNPRSFSEILSNSNLPFPPYLTQRGTIGVQILSPRLEIVTEVVMFPIYSPVANSILHSYTS
ncbi:MAG: hypothetical protein ACOCXQ_02850 [Patescibacteria group bacterium]